MPDQLTLQRERAATSIDVETELAQRQFISDAIAWGALQKLTMREFSVLLVCILNANRDGVFSCIARDFVAALGLDQHSRAKNIVNIVRTIRRRLVAQGAYTILESSRCGLPLICKLTFVTPRATTLTPVAETLSLALRVVNGCRPVIFPMPLYRRVAVAIAAAGANCVIDHDRGVASFSPSDVM